MAAEILKDCVVLRKVCATQPAEVLVHWAYFAEHGIAGDTWVIDGQPVYYTGRGHRNCYICQQRLVGVMPDIDLKSED